MKAKKNYIDHLMKISRFPDFRCKRDFTELMFKKLMAEAAKKCLEIKEKYGIVGKRVTPEKAVEICLLEGMCIDVEPENNHQYKENWFGYSDEGKFVLWISPEMGLKRGQGLIFTGLAIFLLSEYKDLILALNPESDLDALVETPELLRVQMLVEGLTALLYSNESKAQLIAMQSWEKMSVREPVKEESKHVLDLSNHPENFNISAEGLSIIINGDLSKECQDVLREWCAEHAEVNNA